MVQSPQGGSAQGGHGQLRPTRHPTTAGCSRTQTSSRCCLPYLWFFLRLHGSKSSPFRVSLRQYRQALRRSARKLLSAQEVSLQRTVQHYHKSRARLMQGAIAGRCSVSSVLSWESPSFAAKLTYKRRPKVWSSASMNSDSLARPKPHSYREQAASSPRRSTS